MLALAEDRLLGITELAELLGVDPQRLRRDVREGNPEAPPGFQMGNRWKFRASTVRAWIEERDSAAKKRSRTRALTRRQLSVRSGGGR